MLKNNKGVTLSILVVTVIVIIILAGTTLVSSNLLIISTKAKTVVTNMYLVQAKAQALYEEYQFNKTDKSNYFGVNETNVSSYSVNDNGYWYKWTQSDLKNLGFDESMLESGGDFLVNYETGEVIYTKGVKDSAGQVKYKLSDFKK